MFDTDEQIIQAIKSGENQRNLALKHIFITLSYKEIGINFLYNKNCKPEDAEEIVVDALIAFDKNIRNDIFRNQSSLLTYFLAIVKFLFFRRSNNQLKSYENIVDYDLIQKKKKKQLFNENKLAFINNIIQKMENKCKNIFVLLQLDTSYEDIKDELGYKNINMVKKAVYRCRQAFRLYLDQNDEWQNLK